MALNYSGGQCGVDLLILRGLVGWICAGVMIGWCGVHGSMLSMDGQSATSIWAGFHGARRHWTAGSVI